MLFNASLYQRYNVFHTPNTFHTPSLCCSMIGPVLPSKKYFFYPIKTISFYAVHSSLTLSRVEQACSVKRPALPRVA